MTTSTNIHTIATGETLSISVNAGKRYSAEQLNVIEGEEYRIWCDKGQWWVDMIIPVSANGYYNTLANLFGQRLKNERCMCLCGTYDENDKQAFAIGSTHKVTASQTGKLSFFANDVPGYEWNNWGTIIVNIERIL